MDILNILIKIRKILRSLNLESKGVQKEYGLSITQLLFLGHLMSKKDYRATHKEMMELLSLNSSTITGILQRLQKRGYVARMENDKDRRVRDVVLTASGIKLMENTPNVLHERLSKKLKHLSTEDKNQIDKSLDIIISAMEINDLDASPLLTSDDPLD